MEGVGRFETSPDNRLTVTFDDEKTSAEAIRQALAKEGLATGEEPVFLK